MPEARRQKSAVLPTEANASLSLLAVLPLATPGGELLPTVTVIFSGRPLATALCEVCVRCRACNSCAPANSARLQRHLAQILKRLTYLNSAQFVNRPLQSGEHARSTYQSVSRWLHSRSYHWCACEVECDGSILNTASLVSDVYSNNRMHASLSKKRRLSDTMCMSR